MRVPRWLTSEPTSPDCRATSGITCARHNLTARSRRVRAPRSPSCSPIIRLDDLPSMHARRSRGRDDAGQRHQRLGGAADRVQWAAECCSALATACSPCCSHRDAGREGRASRIQNADGTARRSASRSCRASASSSGIGLGRGIERHSATPSTLAARVAATGRARPAILVSGTDRSRRPAAISAARFSCPVGASARSGQAREGRRVLTWCGPRNRRGCARRRCQRLGHARSERYGVSRVAARLTVSCRETGGATTPARARPEATYDEAADRPGACSAWSAILGGADRDERISSRIWRISVFSAASSREQLLPPQGAARVAQTTARRAHPHRRRPADPHPVGRCCTTGGSSSVCASRWAGWSAPPSAGRLKRDTPRTAQGRPGRPTPRTVTCPRR